jgi:hypothetical protein
MRSPTGWLSEAAQHSKICLIIESSIIVLPVPYDAGEPNGERAVKATNAVRLKGASIVARSSINSHADENCNETTALCQYHMACVSTALPPSFFCCGELAAQFTPSIAL